MMKELQQLKNAQATSRAGSSFTTPPPTRRAPTPASAKPKSQPAASSKKPPTKGPKGDFEAAGEDDEDDEDDEDEHDEEPGDSNDDGESVLTEAAKRNKLRRLCEREPSGKRNVPESIGEKWDKKGRDREELL